MRRNGSSRFELHFGVRLRRSNIVARVHHRRLASVPSSARAESRQNKRTNSNFREMCVESGGSPFEFEVLSFLPPRQMLPSILIAALLVGRSVASTYDFCQGQSSLSTIDVN